jgi:hypothetical protein
MTRSARPSASRARTSSAESWCNTNCVAGSTVANRPSRSGTSHVPNECRNASETTPGCGSCSKAMSSSTRDSSRSAASMRSHTTLPNRLSLMRCLERSNSSTPYLRSRRRIARDRAGCDRFNSWAARDTFWSCAGERIC